MYYCINFYTSITNIPNYIPSHFVDVDIYSNIGNYFVSNNIVLLNYVPNILNY